MGSKPPRIAPAKGVTAHNNSWGFRDSGSYNLTIRKSTAYNMSDGFYTGDTDFAYLYDDHAYNGTKTGYYILDSSNVTLNYTEAYLNDIGYYIHYSNNTNMTFSQAHNNSDGVDIVWSLNTSVFNNTTKV